MNRAALVCSIGIILTGCASLASGDDVRVDLFSKSAILEVILSPVTVAVNACEAAARKPCIAVNPGESARCAVEEAVIRCRVGNKALTFNRVSAHADSVFRLDATPLGPGGRGPARGLLTRTIDLRLEEQRLRAVAAVDLETYVRGVLAGEAATLKSPGALQAMAVLARTWALGSRGRHRAEGYDFCSLTHCQFFRPPLAMGTSAAFIEAAERTYGQVLKHRGKIIDAYYSAHCGGRTASAASVWPDRAAPYLRSVLDPYCARDGQRSWEQAIPWADITRVVKQEAAFALHGPVRDLIVDQTDGSGRVRTLRLVSDSSRTIDGNAFRYALNRHLGWNTLKSSLYTIDHRDGGLIFRGRGLGHGVGLCQTGAGQMGRMGIGFEQILAHYFPGASVESLAGGGRSKVLSSEHFEFFFPPEEAALVSRALDILEAERSRLGARVRVLPGRVTVRTHASTEMFVRATGQPGWVSGSSDGSAIELQPLSILESRGILRATLYHELLHLVIHRLRAPKVPDWYEEGMILYLTGERVELPAGGITNGGDSSLAGARVKMQKSYAAARERVADLARRRGENALWQVLQHPTPEDLKWFKKGW